MWWRPGSTIGLGGCDCGSHIAGARAADPERGAEAPAGAGITVRHVDGAAFVRRNHRLEFCLPCERRQERIDQAAGHHEQVSETLRHERVEDVVGAELGRHGMSARERMVAVM
jgi:hypothetical protein